MIQETFTRPQLLKAVREAQERFELAGQALIDGLTRENAELRDALACALDDWIGLNGRITDRTDPHWSNDAISLLGTMEISGQ